MLDSTTERRRDAARPIGAQMPGTLGAGQHEPRPSVRWQRFDAVQPSAPAACGRRAASRFEEMTESAGSISGLRQEILGALLKTTVPLTTGGCPALKPLWRSEAIDRADDMIRLIARLEQTAPLSACDLFAARLERRLALELAGTFQALDVVDDSRVLPCSDLLRTLVRDLIELFGPVAGHVGLHTCVEPIQLPAYRRRALVLIASALVCDALSHGPIPGGDGGMAMLLLRVDAARALFRIDMEGWRAPRVGRARPFEMVANLASLLEGEPVYRTRAFSGATVEIAFPIQRRAEPYGRLEINDGERNHAQSARQ